MNVHLSLNSVYSTTTGISGTAKETATPVDPCIKDPLTDAATDSAKVIDETDVACRRRPVVGEVGDCACKPSVEELLGRDFARQICTLPFPFSVVL